MSYKKSRTDIKLIYCVEIVLYCDRHDVKNWQVCKIKGIVYIFCDIKHVFFTQVDGNKYMTVILCCDMKFRMPRLFQRDQYFNIMVYYTAADSQIWWNKHMI